MAEVFNNMARSTLASAITNADLSLTLATGDGNSLFPTLGVGDYCRCVLFNRTTGNTEIIKVTARSGDALTIERAAEKIGNTSPAVAYAFNAGDIIELRPTKAFFDSLTVTDAEIQAGDYLYCVDSSATANDIAIAANPTVTVLAAGMGFRVKVAVTNTGATTLTVDGTAATAIRKHNDQALTAGDLEAGGIYDFVYDGTYYQLLTPTAVAPLKNVFTTRGDMVRAGVSGAAERVALGTTGYILRSDGTDIAYATPYQAATVYISTDQAHSSSGSWVDVAFDTESFDPLTAHSAGTFTVPAWANKARFSANIAFEGSGAGPTGRRAARVVTGAGAVLTPNIYKIVDPSADVSGDTMVPLISGIFPVTASGTYKIQAFQNSGGTIQINGTNSVTWATVEFFP